MGRLNLYNSMCIVIITTDFQARFEHFQKRNQKIQTNKNCSVRVSNFFIAVCSKMATHVVQILAFYLAKTRRRSGWKQAFLCALHRSTRNKHFPCRSAALICLHWKIEEKIIGMQNTLMSYNPSLLLLVRLTHQTLRNPTYCELKYTAHFGNAC